jgi:hypothetical protein
MLDGRWHVQECPHLLGDYEDDECVGGQLDIKGCPATEEASHAPSLLSSM